MALTVKPATTVFQVPKATEASLVKLAYLDRVDRKEKSVYPVSLEFKDRKVTLDWTVYLEDQVKRVIAVSLVQPASLDLMD